MENNMKTPTEFRNDYFGTFTRVSADGLYARHQEGEAERLIFYLGDPHAPRFMRDDLEHPVCDRITLTPQGIECHYGPTVLFEAREG